MNKQHDLLKRAWADMEQIQPNLDRDDDEIFLDVAAYHLQQAIEKMLKFEINSVGQQFRWTHSILELCNQADEYSISYPEWVYQNAETLTSYAEKTRYGKDLVGNRRKITELLVLTRKWYENIKQRQLEQQKTLEKSSVFIKPKHSEN